ncbi:MAG: hypothetical protein H7Y32_01920, partial [Chloroflexales bacterium]|nr:hypothetical protein [Chloroflexales bacterium]
FQTYRAGDAEAATRLAAEVLHDPAADAVDTVRAASLQGLIEQDAGNLQQARAYFQRAFALAHAHALHDDAAAVQCNLGLLALVEGQLDEAEMLNHKSYRYFSEMRVPIMMGTIATTLGFIAVIRAQPHEAATWLHRGITLLTEAQETTYLLYGLLACSGLASLRGEPLQAAALLHASSAHAQRVGLQFMPSLLELVQQSVQRAPAKAGRPVDAATPLQSLEQLVSSTLVWLDAARDAASRN